MPELPDDGRGPVTAFDPAAGTFHTGAQAPPGAVAVPDLDGSLLADPAVRAAAADDFGHVVHRTPAAVLRPGSVQDVARLVRFADRHRIPVAVRGQGHATGGQAQVTDGVVIDARPLDRVHEVRPDRAVVDAGVTWGALARHTLADGVIPPVLPDHLDLSVGGTLSAGGIGGSTHRYGLQADSVLECDVVTGTGELLRCSPTEHRSLFDAVLGGLGQYAVIVRATVALVAAPPRVRVYELAYADLDTYLADTRRCVAHDRFDSLHGQARPHPSGGWTYVADATRYLTDPSTVESSTVESSTVDGLRCDPAGTVVTEHPFGEWIDRLRPGVELMRAAGLWDVPHPWINLFLPASTTAAVVSATLADLTVADTGEGPVLLYPFRTDRLHRPFVPVPDEPEAFLFAVLRNTVAPATVDAQLAANRAVFERARRAGGVRYPVGSVPSTPDDWRDHYGAAYPAVVAAKDRWDPRRILAPGHGILAAPR